MTGWIPNMLFLNGENSPISFILILYNSMITQRAFCRHRERIFCIFITNCLFVVTPLVRSEKGIYLKENSISFGEIIIIPHPNMELLSHFFKGTNIEVDNNQSQWSNSNKNVIM